jgi:tripartite-type tricarboxylate transporter receptor subunit TctC
VLWGSAGPTDGPTGSAAFTCEALHIACKVILGYPGSSEMMLALSRSEVDANYLSESSAYNLVEGGQARALTALSRTRSPLLPQVPTIFELFRFDADAQWLLDFRANLNDLGRILVTQAGTQPERLALLQSAIRQVLTDPEIVAEGRRTGRIVEFQEAAVARAKAVSVLQAISPEQKERVRAIALEKYLR